jgi:hypothetical protein
VEISGLLQLVRKLEQAEPGWSGADVAAFLRRGVRRAGHAAFDAAELEALRRLSAGEEVVVDPTSGAPLSFDRVIAGIVVALSPDPAAGGEGRSEALSRLSDLPLPVEVGESSTKADRVASSTILRDLARWQAGKLLVRAAVPKFDELYSAENEPRRVSDVDAYRIGRWLTRDKEGKKLATRLRRPGGALLSSLLDGYYASTGPIVARNRFRALAADRDLAKDLTAAVKATTIDESWRRAKYKLETGDELRGFAWSARAAELEAGSLAAVNDAATRDNASRFQQFLQQKAKAERDD